MDPDMDMPMEMGAAVPGWVDPLAWTSLVLSLASAMVIAGDIYLGRRRHPTSMSEWVWVSSALYLGPFTVALYWARGRCAASSTDQLRSGASPGLLMALLAGGSASAVAHLIAVPAVERSGWTIAGLAMWPMILVIAVLVIAMLTTYELVAARTAHPARPSRPVFGAVLVAVLTVAAFDIGMVGWMLVLHYNDAMPGVGETSFWFLMQVGVLIGLVTGLPAVRWLLHSRTFVAPA